MSTIYALSTPPGYGGIAVIRSSGTEAWAGLKKLLGEKATIPAPRQAALRYLRHPDNPLDILDHAMVVWFKAPASFTGEDCVEYHIHGGPSVVQSVLAALGRIDDFRLAEPGEFTRRAFENGKMDLTSAEAIADLIHAETEEQRRQALRQMSGSLEKIYEDWKERLARLLALMEADLDFSDQDLPDDILLKVRPNLSDIETEIASHLDDNRRGELLRDGVKLVILGAPNAGKSSLINQLTHRDVAIVSPIAGTTRDSIDVHLNIGGYPVILTDTAGLRPDQLGQSDHETLEMEGIRRAIRKAETADLKILVFDSTAEPDPHSLNLIDDTALIVLNKIDETSANAAAGDLGGIRISAKTGEGIDRLLAEIKSRVESLCGRHDTPSLTRIRHREALEDALDALRNCADAPLPELAAEDVRLAIRHLGRITGRVDVEDLLDMIFRDFCIGK